MDLGEELLDIEGKRYQGLDRMEELRKRLEKEYNPALWGNPGTHMQRRAASGRT